MDRIPESLKPARFAALDLLRDYNVLEPPVNISKFLEGENISIFEFPFPSEIDDLAWMLDIEKRIIFINENDDDHNKSFTVAHELWHWIMHKEVIKKKPEKYSIVSRKRWLLNTEDDYEKEADCFARNLLVPKFLLDKFIENYSIVDLSKIFGTSPYLIEKRISQEYWM